MNDEQLSELYMPILAEHGHGDADVATVAKIVGMVKSRINFVKDLWEQSKFFFEAPTTYAEKDVRKRWKEGMATTMAELIEVLRGIDDFSSAAAEPIVLGWIAEHGYHLGNVMNAFRLTVVGECKGPHMFDITEVLGREETIRRIQAGIDNIKPAE